MTAPQLQVLAGFQGVDLNTADGTFESGVTGWTPSNGTFAQSAVQAHTGTHSGLLTTTGTPSQAYVRNPLVTVTPLGWYEVSMWVYSGQAAVLAAIDWYAAGVVYITTVTTSYTVTVNTWTQITVGGTAPSNAVQAQAGPTLTSPATGTKIYVDDYFGPVTGPGAMTDISAYVLGELDVTRPSTRVQGPLWEYQAGTCSVILDNSGGQFDPDNLAGPYVTAGTLTATTVGQDSVSWTAPVNLYGATMDARCWGDGGFSSIGAGTGSGGGEYAEEPFLPVAAGQVFTCQTGLGVNGLTADTIFGTVHAHHGGYTSASGAGGTGSANTIHHDGGAGGATGGNFGGGGGGGAGPHQSGNAGTAGSTTNDPAPGGLPVAGGGQGGNGGDTTVLATDGMFPGGGAGAAGNNGFDGGENGGVGQIQILYRVATGTPVTCVGPGIAIQVLATWSGTTYSLFTGNADAWTETAVDYEGGYSEITLTASDGFEILSNVLLPASPPLGAGEDAGARTTRILNAAGWPAAARSITTGDGLQQGATFFSDALSLLQLTTDTETGEIYVSGAGNLVFRHRRAVITDTRSNTVQAVFGDLPGTSHTAGTELAMATVGRANDNTTLANDIQITTVGSGNMQEAQDLASEQVSNGPRSYQRTDLLLIDDPSAFQYANWVLTLSKMSEDRFDTITVDPNADTADLYPQVLGRDIGDRIEVWKRPPNVTAFSKDVFIRSIAHTIDTAQSPPAWATTWTLQSAAKYSQFFILNSAASGVLDTNTLCY